MYKKEGGQTFNENSEDSLLKQISKTFPGGTKFIYIVTIHLRGEERRGHSVMSRMIIQ